MYECEDMEKLEKYRAKLVSAIKNSSNYPKEEELPLIYLKNSMNTIDLQANYGVPYYNEIDISLVNGTNTSNSRKIIYSDYVRVLRCIPYILQGKCRPISILRRDNVNYIENGKHRYLAHILLGKSKIPVSIRECVKDREEDLDFIQYKRNLFEDDGYRISYPEKILEFYEQNKEIFSDIKRVEMKCIEENKKYKLIIKKRNQDELQILNSISSGNNIRSSIAAMNLIKECGYDIDEEYIMTHKEFVLEDKYDANNLKFNSNVLPMDAINEIKIHIGTMEKYNYEDEKINKLHNFLSNNKVFNTCGTHMDIFHTGKIKLNAVIYYIVSSEDKDNSNRIYSYIFMQENVDESNLKTKYLGRADYKDFF